MRTFRYWVRFLSTFFGRFKRIFIVSILLGITLFLLSTTARGVLSFFQPGQSTGVVGRLTLDDLPSSIQSEISYGLTRLDESNQPKPALAKSWYSEDEGRVWIFQLGDYQWQDGTRVTAKDINYRFRDATKEIVDEKTIKFTLKDPFAPFPSTVARPIFKTGLLGAGDWKVARFSSLSAQLNRSLQLINTRTKEKKTYRFYLTEDEARTAFKLGQVRQITDIVDPKELLDWRNATVEATTHEDRYAGVFLNVEDSLLSEKNIRQALAYAIEKENFEDHRAISPISPASWAFNSQVKEYPYNPERAKELIKGSPLSPEQKSNLHITLVVTPPSLLGTADKIKKDWEAVGVKTTIQVQSTPPSEFQALLAVQIPTKDPDQYSLWHSTQTESNITNYRKTKESPRIDKLLEDGRRTQDQEARRTIYFDFQRFLMEDLPVIPLFHPQTYTIKRK